MLWYLGLLSVSSFIEKECLWPRDWKSSKLWQVIDVGLHSTSHLQSHFTLKMWKRVNASKNSEEKNIHQIGILLDWEESEVHWISHTVHDVMDASSQAAAVPDVILLNDETVFKRWCSTSPSSLICYTDSSNKPKSSRTLSTDLANTFFATQPTIVSITLPS